MLIITNSKIASFQAEYKEFRGFSCLFDPPNNEREVSRLYALLYEALQEIGPASMTNAYLFCPLPFHSYHVTVWDGVNDENLETIIPTYRDYFRNFLGQLFSSTRLGAPFAEMITSSQLIKDNNWGIRFKFKKLFIWAGSQALVAQLEAADDESEGRLAILEKERAALYNKFEEALGISMYRSYTPHITLGYFANEECALRATAEVNKWNVVFEKVVEEATIQFDSISLYGFDDMTNFFKTPQRSSIRYSAGVPGDQKVIQRLMGMYDFYRTIPDFYGDQINKQTIEKMRKGIHSPDQEKMKKHEESYYTSLIIKLSKSEGTTLFHPISTAYAEIISLIKRYYPMIRTEAYLDSAHLTIRSMLHYKKQSFADLERYKKVLYPKIKKWVDLFSADTVLYAKGLHVSLSSFKGLSIGFKVYPSTPFVQALRGAAGIALYNAQDAGILKMEELWEETKSAEWHTKLTHSTGLRVRDPAFLPPWSPEPIPEREKAFIDAFEALIKRYENVVFGKISNIQLDNIFIRNGKSDKLTVGSGAGIEISLS